MNKIFFLSTCDTCKRIINELDLKDKKFEFQDIKTQRITSNQLDELKEKAGSYEALFGKVSRKYKELRLSDKKLTEADMKNFILEEYTFLKRPVILVQEKIFIGNAKKTIEEIKKVV